MARPKSRQRNTEPQVTDTPTNTNTNTNTGERIKMALSPEQIQELLGKTRTKGQYVTYLNDFVNSGEGGICVNETFADLSSKKATTLKQGFEHAKENKEATEGAENVKVLVNEDKVYLINLGAAEVAA